MLNLNFQDHLISPEWYAKTYGEYLLHRADDFTKLQDALAEAVVAGSDAMFQDCEDEMDLVNNQLKERLSLIATDLGYNLDELETTSDEFNEVAQAFAHDEEVAELMTLHFNSPDIVQENYLRMELPTYDYHLSTPDLSESFSDVTSLVSTDLPNSIQFLKSYDLRCDEIAVAVLENLEMEDGSVALNGGFTTTKELVKAVASNANCLATDKAKLLLSTTKMDGSIHSPKLSLSEGYSMTSLGQEVDANLSAVVQMGAGFIACTKENITDRITAFESIAQSKLGEAANRIDNYTKIIKSRLSDAKSTVQNFFEFFKTTTNIDKYGESDGVQTLDESWIVQYTGATPVAALNFSAAQEISSAIANVVAGVVRTVFGAIFTAVGVGLMKGINFLHTTISNPVDLEKISNSGSGLVDQFQFQEKNELHSLYTGDFFDNWTDQNNFGEMLHDKFWDKWFCYESIFGEHFFKVNEVYAHASGFNNFRIIDTHTFKPRCINPDCILSAIRAADSMFNTSVYSTWIEQRTVGPTTFPVNHYLLDTSQISNNDNPSTIIAWWQFFGDMLSSYPDRILEPKDQIDSGTIYSNENNLQLGFELATILENYLNTLETFYVEQQIFDLSSVETDYPFMTISDVKLTSTPHFSVDFCEWNHRSQVTNLDFVKSTSGYITISNVDYYKNMYMDQIYSYTHSAGNVYYDPVSFNFQNLFMLVLNSYLDKQNSPSSFMYVPYSSNMEAPEDAQFRIKTDAENSAALSSFLTGIVIITIVAVTAIALVSAVKWWKRRRYFKKATYNGKLDSGMWEGVLPSAKEQKKYIKNQKKMNKSTIFGGTVENTASLMSNIDNINNVGMNMYGQLSGQKTISGSAIPVKDSINNDNPLLDTIRDLNVRIKDLIKIED